MTLKAANQLSELFTRKQKGILNIYCTAGYPHFESTIEVLMALQQHGADIIELGMPYSDPLADGEVIQHSSSVALENGMTIAKLFEQLDALKTKSDFKTPIVLMGYLNPVMQYGFENFCAKASEAGVAGLILPDLPMYEYETVYDPILKKYGLDFIFLITPETTDERIKQIDEMGSGFVYAVSSSSTTGKNKNIDEQEAYFEKLKKMQLKNPVLVGFGIKDNDTFKTACKHTNGAIIGSAYIKALKNATDINQTTKEFLQSVLQ